MECYRRILRGIAGLVILILPTLAILSPNAAVAEVEIKVRNFEFVPRDTTIPVGESVKWSWESGTHTTTNGTGSNDPNAGLLWNSTISFSNQTFTYQFNEEGFFPYFCVPHELSGMTGSITVQAPTGIGDEAGAGGGAIPRAISLSQNYPNPFNPSTTFRVTIPNGNPQAASLRIHDLRGAVVKTIYEGTLAGGEYHFSWDGKSEEGEKLPSGIYLYRLEHGDRVVMKKMTLLK